MINLQHCHEWRYIDEETGLLFPWYTKPALDIISKWDLEKMTVFEYGMGSSSIWWANRCKWLCGVESNREYYDAVQEQLKSPTILYEPNDREYSYSIRTFENLFDIVVVDGIERDNCIYHSAAHVKIGGVLIIDNWDQPSVWTPSDQIKDFLLSFYHEPKVCKEPTHPDWQTAIFERR